MKVTIDVPDTTKCAFVNLIYYTATGIMMHTHSIDTDELRSGEVITIKEGGDANCG